MTGWPGQPVIYEINTAVWLNELARAGGRRMTLADVAAADWDAVTPAGVDAVWLMGVWERSPAGLALANANAELQRSFRDALPDLERADVVGSPYCVRRYVADAAFGGPDGLAVARAALITMSRPSAAGSPAPQRMALSRSSPARRQPSPPTACSSSPSRGELSPVTPGVATPGADVAHEGQGGLGRRPQS